MIYFAFKVPLREIMPLWAFLQLFQAAISVKLYNTYTLLEWSKNNS